MDAALRSDILAEQQHARIELQLLVERAADGRDHVDPLALGLRRHRSMPARSIAGVPHARRSACISPSKKTWSVHASGDRKRRAPRPRRAPPRLRHAASRSSRPIPRRRSGSRRRCDLELRQWIARPFGLRLRPRTCRSACPGSCGPAAAARSGAAVPGPLPPDMAHRLRRSAAPPRPGSVPSPLKIVQARRSSRGWRRCRRPVSGSPTAPRCRSHCPRCRRASAIVCVVAMVSADQKPSVAQLASPPSTTAIASSGPSFRTFVLIVDRLRPAGGRRVLRADSAAHRQARARRRDWDS